MDKDEYRNKIHEILKSAETAPVDEYSRSLNRFISNLFIELIENNSIDFDCLIDKPFFQEIDIPEDNSKGNFLFQTKSLKKDISALRFSETKSLKKGNRYIFYLSQSFKDYQSNYRLDFCKI